MNAKDLTKEPPRSPRVRIRDYAVLARTLDKCRSLGVGKIGDYHYDCPLDNALFGFKGISGDDLRRYVETGATDDEVGIWVDKNGIPKTPEEIKGWSDFMETYTIYDDPDKRDFFVGECEKLGLDPKTTKLFDWLEADDRASF